MQHPKLSDGEVWRGTNYKEIKSIRKRSFYICRTELNIYFRFKDYKHLQ